MGKIVWLASYPKSGNTWVRVFLTNYMRDGDDRADINDLDDGPIASNRFCFDELVGINASDLTPGEIERYRPDIYRFLAEEEDGTIFMKVHDAYILNDLGKPLFPPSVTTGAVYIIRNPPDVAVSLAHHYGIDMDKAVSNLCDPSYGLVDSADRIGSQLRQRLLSWSGHVTSWTGAPDIPVRVFRYEDMRVDPFTTFSEMVRFVGLDYDPGRLRKAVAFSDFETLKAQELDGGFRERPLKASAPFFRKGRVGSWREELHSGQMEKLISAHGAVMQKFGYLDENGRPVY